MDEPAFSMLSAGNLLVDTVYSVPEGFPERLGLEPGSTTHADPETAREILDAMQAERASRSGMAIGSARSPGGCSAVTGSVCAALGMSVACAGSVGADAPGAWYAAEIAARGMESRIGLCPDVPTGQFVAFHEPSGRKTAIVAPGAAFHGPDPDLGGYRSVLHLDALLEAKAGRLADWIAEGRGAGMRVTLDLSASGFVARAREGLASLIGRCDVIFANEAEMLALTLCTDFEAAEKSIRLRWPGSRWILKRGKAGVVYMGPEGGLFVPAPRVAVVDDTGAGDAFAGAFICGMMGSDHDRFSGGGEAGIGRWLGMGSAAAGVALETLGTGFDPRRMRDAVRKASGDALGQKR